MNYRKSAVSILISGALLLTACSQDLNQSAVGGQAEAVTQTEMAAIPTSENMAMEKTSAPTQGKMQATEPTADMMMEATQAATEAMNSEMPAATDEMMGSTPADLPNMESEMATPTEDMMETQNQAEMSGSQGQGTAVPEDSGAGMIETPAWFNVTLTDVTTGKEFTIGDFKGKVVLVETMAIWCPNCLQQQDQVKALHDLLGPRDDLISLGLDVDPNESAAMLQSYTLSNGFDWLYAVAPVDVAHDLGQLYGAQFLNPPSTPILIVDRDGIAHPLPFGIKRVDKLKDFVETYLGGM